MAKCPHCFSEVSFLIIFKPGGRWKCKSCLSDFYKKPSNELRLILPGIFLGLIAGYLTGYFLVLCGVDHTQAFFAGSIFLVAQMIALLSGFLIWKFFIKL